MADGRTEVLLFGLGAIGSFYAFILSRNENVRLSVVARSNYDSIVANGLKIESQNHGTHMVKIDKVLKTPQEAGHRFDYIVCAHKAVNSDSIPPMFISIADENTTFTIMQNGVGNEEPFRKHFPKSTIISCVVWVGATQYQPGVVSHTSAERTEMGLYTNEDVDKAGEIKRLNLFADLMRQGGTKISIEDDIQTKRWEKVVWNVAWNALTTLTMIDTHTWLSSSSDATPMTRRLMEDVIAVGRKCGVPLENSLVDVLLERIMAIAPIYSSMYADMKSGRALEVDVILGYPMKKAKEFGMDVPTLTAVYAIIMAVDLRLRRDREKT